jgi:hypothetical protein
MGYPAAFDLKNGSHYEGYILEIGENSMKFGGGGR